MGERGEGAGRPCRRPPTRGADSEALGRRGNKNERPAGGSHSRGKRYRASTGGYRRVIDVHVAILLTGEETIVATAAEEGWYWRADGGHTRPPTPAVEVAERWLRGCKLTGAEEGVRSDMSVRMGLGRPSPADRLGLSQRVRDQKTNSNGERPVRGWGRHTRRLGAVKRMNREESDCGFRCTGAVVRFYEGRKRQSRELQILQSRRGATAGRPHALGCFQPRRLPSCPPSAIQLLTSTTALVLYYGVRLRTHARPNACAA